MVFHVAVCSADAALRTALQRICSEYFLRRGGKCIVEQMACAAALLQRDTAGARYELYLLELERDNAQEGLAAAAALRSRGCRAPLAFFARTTAHAYKAYKVDAMQYFTLPVRQEELFALLDRAVEPEYGPAMPVSTATGLRVVPFASIEYLECTHHVAHFHLAGGEDVTSLSLRVSFAQMAQPLLEDGRFLQPHRSYVINFAEVKELQNSEFVMNSGARVPIPRGRESAVRVLFKNWLAKARQR